MNQVPSPSVISAVASAIPKQRPASHAFKKKRLYSAEVKDHLLYRNHHWSTWPVPVCPPFIHSLVHATISRISHLAPSLPLPWSRHRLGSFLSGPPAPTLVPLIPFSARHQKDPVKTYIQSQHSQAGTFQILRSLQLVPFRSLNPTRAIRAPATCRRLRGTLLPQHTCTCLSPRPGTPFP